MAPLIPGPHSQCFLVHLQNRLFLGDVVAVALAQGDDLLHHLGVIAAGLGLGHDLFLALGHVLLFGFHLLILLDELAQLVCRDVIGVIVLHDVPRWSGRNS